jgi:hypothetical protein
MLVFSFQDVGWILPVPVPCAPVDTRADAPAVRISHTPDAPTPTPATAEEPLPRTMERLDGRDASHPPKNSSTKTSYCNNLTEPRVLVL